MHGASADSAEPCSAEHMSRHALKNLRVLNVACRARTGSGKTLAYLLPVLHRLLTVADEVAGNAAGANSAQPGAIPSFTALVLVPTRELCEQVRAEAQAVAQHCGANITVTALVAEGGAQLKRAVQAAGHLVVATPGAHTHTQCASCYTATTLSMQPACMRHTPSITPPARHGTTCCTHSKRHIYRYTRTHAGKVAAALRDGLLSSGVLGSRLRSLVLDEADLLLSYGYEEDLQLLAPLVRT